MPGLSGVPDEPHSTYNTSICYRLCLKQFYIRLGAGPQWCSWWAPRRPCVIYDRGQRCGGYKRAPCRRQYFGVIARPVGDDGTTVLQDRPRCEHRGHMGHGAGRTETLHRDPRQHPAGRIEGEVRITCIHSSIDDDFIIYWTSLWTLYQHWNFPKKCCFLKKISHDYVI